MSDVIRRNDMQSRTLSVSQWIQSRHKRGNKLDLTHPLQREERQWTVEEKGNLIRRVILGDRIPSLYIARQKDEIGGNKEYLIDGKQRFSTLESFINNEFSISPKTRLPFITYRTVKCEMIEKYGKLIPKLNRKGDIIPIPDENGEEIPEAVTIDIRRLKFKQLPPELRDAVMSYSMDAMIRLDATDEDIQQDILDYNSGRPMNKAQIGVNCLGKEWATEIRRLSEHPFIKDCCMFSQSNITKGEDLRALNEALMLINFPDDWRSDSREIGDFLGKNLQMSYIDGFRENLDALSEIVPVNNKETAAGLQPKDFFIVMANFDYFMSMYGDSRNTERYAEFLHCWLNDYRQTIIKNKFTAKTNEPMSYMTYIKGSSKSKDNVAERLEIMNKYLDAFMEGLKIFSLGFKDGEFVIEHEEERTQSKVIFDYSPEEDLFESEDESYESEARDTEEDDDTWLLNRALMIESDYPWEMFDKCEVNRFKRKWETLDKSDKDKAEEHTEQDMELVKDNLKREVSKEHLLCLIGAVCKASDEADESVISSWVKHQSYDVDPELCIMSAGYYRTMINKMTNDLLKEADEAETEGSYLFDDYDEEDLFD